MLTLQDVNALSREEFVARLGFLFEGSPWIAAETWPARPFESLDALHAALLDTVARAGRERQLALIRAHPDLAGKAAVAGELTPESTREQAAAGLSQLTPDEYAEFTRLNQAYRERFGFPFVICVRDHTRASILAAFEERLGGHPDEELRTALGQVVRIARLRLDDALQEEARA